MKNESKTMSEDEIKSAVKSFLSGLSIDRKLYVLSLLVHNVTISGRAIYSERGNGNGTIEKLYALNEVQHGLSSQMMHITSGDGEAQPDDAFIDSLYSCARLGDCEGELNSALKYTLSATAAVKIFKS